MAQLTLQVDSPQTFEELKSVLSLMKGVRIISADSSSADLSGDHVPNATTLAAMNEARSGRDAGVVRVDTFENFLSSMEG